MTATTHAELLTAVRQAVPRPRPLQRIARSARPQPLGVFGGAVLLLFVGLAWFGGAIAPHDPRQLRAGRPLDAPSWEHPFGTNQLGQDVLSRVIAGARISLIIGASAVLLGGG